ncbi:MFS transporter [Dyella amyloliquefaciens]|uniref:MFS transporter n=1 Tax=Dyella amyloliquefaciens TaxID=1770545 RepID=UPI00102E4F71|nr:MFS transporter [Dyella amyloliquefaciens]
MSAVAIGEAPRKAVRNAVIGLITLAMFTGTATRYVLSPVQELVRLDLGLSDNQMALLQGMAIALPTALISIPIGRLVDRTNRTRLLIILALVCAAGSLLTVVAHNFITAFVARMLVCAAVVAAQPAALSLVSDVTDARQRGRVITLTSLGQALGGTMAYVLAGPLLRWLPTVVPIGSGLATLAPWRLVQLAFAAAVLVASAALLFMREPVRREAGAALGDNLHAALRELWRYRKFLLPLFGGMMTVGMADAAASVWAVPVLTRTFHQTPADFGTWMGLLMLGSNVVGAVIGGTTADFAQRKRGRGGALLGAVLGAALSIPAALFPVMPDVTWFAVLMGVLLTSGACVNIAATSAMMVILPNELRGICMSLLVAVMGLAAFGVAPLLVSLTTQAFAHGADVAISLACVGLVTSLLGTVSFISAMRVAAHPAAN